MHVAGRYLRGDADELEEREGSSEEGAVLFA